MDEMGEEVDSPYAKVQQSIMEIKREELKWLQNALKQENQKTQQLTEQSTQKQQLLSNILDKLNNQYSTFTQAARELCELQIPTEHPVFK